MTKAFETIIDNAISGRDKSIDRPTAVAAALELIALRMTSATQHQYQLGNEMDKLSKYADQIQEALKAK